MLGNVEVKVFFLSNNIVGVSFWDALLNEFNISPDGSIHDSEKGFDEVFFSAVCFYL